MGYTKVVRTGDFVEVFAYERDLPQRPKIASRTTKGRRVGTRRTPRRYDHVRRLAKSFRRLVRANLVGDTPPAFLTLTMLQVLSLSTSSKFLKVFFVRLRRHYRREFRYIFVPEWQKRGAVHFHILIWGLHEEEIKIEQEVRTIQRLWGLGFVDCITTDGHPKLAGYLAKYMQKSMLDIRLRGKRAFGASRNILRPMHAGSHSMLEYLPEIVGVDNSPLQVRTFKTDWLGNCHYQQFKLSSNEQHDTT